ncbi:MAG TPA: hypothetical protein VF669_22200 [Tepidisphaeraceae bacterium]|jgi:spermidine synthase
MTTTEAEKIEIAYDAPTTQTAPGGGSQIRRPYLDLFLISFLILFTELACIRWFGATVVFLTFFTNIVLMATFLGMSVGLMTASRRTNFIKWVLPLMCFSVACAIIVNNAYNRPDSRLAISVGGNDQGNPQLIFFGTEYRYKDPNLFVIPMPVVAGFFFTLIAITFVGLGQTMGRAFDAIPNRVGAYSIDVLGSLTGIACFGLASWFWTSPHIWFMLIVLLCLYFVRPWTGKQVVAALVTMFMIAVTAYGVGPTGKGSTFWSPYYRISYVAQDGGIDTNGIAHQQMMPVSERGPAYLMPHLLNRDAGNKPFKDIMIIGAGSGNDISGALKSGVEHIDAVEIDPVINWIGRQDHPDEPYSVLAERLWGPKTHGDYALTTDAKKWGIHLDDGRSFVKKTPKQYDYISYALVDSLVLHSGYSSLRLESFLFTKEAMQDIKAKLKPGGVFAMYNYYRQGWVVARLKKMAQEVFGVEPIVISMPYQKEIKLSDDQRNHITYLVVGKPLDSANAPATAATTMAAASTQPATTQAVVASAAGKVPALEAIRAKFAQAENFWVNEKPSENERINAYRATPPGAPATQPASYYQANASAAAPWRLISPSKVETEGSSVIMPEDNWPFLYLREKTIPKNPGLVGMGVIGGLSLVILMVFTWPVWFSRDPNRSRRRFNLQMFFLGAGFMLLETKGVVHMALLFGSTWVVNSIVFFAILVMILLANLFVIALKPRNLWPWYGLLGLALIAGAIIPMNYFLTMDQTPRIVLSCAVFFVPVFFAGVIFATSFRDSVRPDVDFGSNVAGIILGGLSEQLSLMIGFNYLLLVALGFYFLSAVFKPRVRVEETVDATAAAPA